MYTGIVDETNNYQLWELIQKITWFHIVLSRNKIFTISNHQPHQANKRYFSLEAGRNYAWKITVSQPGLVPH